MGGRERLSKLTDAKGEAVAWLALLLAFAAYLWIFLPLVPGAPGDFGSDYSLHFPNLLAGYFHFLANGAFSVPWFSPAECAGVPFLADPNVGFYSLPQWLTFVVDPVAAVQATFVVFAALGAAGFYLLARTRFGLSPAAALTAAVIFLFNGFFAYRMARGHLTFHPFALTPWLAWLALPPARVVGPRAWTWSRAVLTGAGAALIFAYEFQAGMVHAILPAALAVAAIVVIHGHLKGHAWQPWAILAGAAILSLLLSAERLAASLAFLASAPRDLYPLPGFDNLWSAVWVAAEALFWRAPREAGMAATTNIQIALGKEEWEYGLGPAAAVLLIAGGVAVIVGLIRRGVSRPRLVRGTATGLAILLALAAPFFLNWYTPGWNAVLKGLPIFGSSVTLVRWFVVFIPLAALGCGLAVDRVLPAGWMRAAAFAIVAVTTVGWNVSADKAYYASGYDAGPIVESWRAVRTAADIPPISRVVVPRDENGRIVFRRDRNNELVSGASQLVCYQPIFGYRLEAFPRREVRPGTILDRTPSGDFNFKNPSCYLFPEENGCRPGDNFRVDQVDDVILFAQYLEFPFRRSAIQTIADRVNLAAVLLTVLGVAIAAVAGVLRRRKGRAAPASTAAPNGGTGRG